MNGKELKRGVYFVLCSFSGQRFIKIGMYTDSPKKRMGGLQVGCPIPLILLGTINGIHRKYLDWTSYREQRLHERFAHLRQQGEWFKAEPELLEYIKENAKDVNPMAEELLTDQHNPPAVSDARAA